MHSAPFGISLGRSGNGLQYEVLFLNRMHDGMMESYTLLDCFSNTWSYAPKLQWFLFLSIFRVRGGGMDPGILVFQRLWQSRNSIIWSVIRQSHARVDSESWYVSYLGGPFRSEIVFLDFLNEFLRWNEQSHESDCSLEISDSSKTNDTFQVGEGLSRWALLLLE